MLLVTALALLITGCSTDAYCSNKPAVPKETITHHFFVSELGRRKTVEVLKICGGAENKKETETQQTFVNGLLGFITLGIYTAVFLLFQLIDHIAQPDRQLICTAH